MVKVKGCVWAICDVAGIIPLVLGALGVISLIPLGLALSEVLLAIGIVLISVSSAFIALDGSRLKKEHREYERFDRIRENARLVPDDLEEGYMIDYTADPDCAISYNPNKPEPQPCGEESDDGFSNGRIVVLSE
ncbi:MAG: hypothetical protein LBU30_01750 [Candidatus Methanoplasma sp.]|jgi:hypothetical protein|nr:hypothetical protein [Candidatus Methanoplasma sp.]